MTVTRGRISEHVLISKLYLYATKNSRIFLKYSNQNDGNKEAHNNESHKQMVEDEVHCYERCHLDGDMDQQMGGLLDRSINRKMVKPIDGLIISNNKQMIFLPADDRCDTKVTNRWYKQDQENSVTYIVT